MLSYFVNAASQFDTELEKFAMQLVVRSENLWASIWKRRHSIPFFQSTKKSPDGPFVRLMSSYHKLYVAL